MNSDIIIDLSDFTAGTLLNDTIYKNLCFINFRFFYINIRIDANSGNPNPVDHKIIGLDVYARSIFGCQ
jgi:hypothetical protein